MWFSQVHLLQWFDTCLSLPVALLCQDHGSASWWHAVWDSPSNKQIQHVVSEKDVTEKESDACCKLWQETFKLPRWFASQDWRHFASPRICERFFCNRRESYRGCSTTLQPEACCHEAWSCRLASEHLLCWFFVCRVGSWIIHCKSSCIQVRFRIRFVW